MCFEKPTDWARWLPLTEYYWYNTAHLKLFMDKKPPLHLLPYFPSKIEAREETIKE